jgi:hypothetical protein
MSKELTWNEEFGTGGKLDCMCDQCKKKVTYKFSKKPDYKGTQSKLKAKGWIARKLGVDWYDFCCEDCFDKFREEDN